MGNEKGTTHDTVVGRFILSFRDSTDSLPQGEEMNRVATRDYRLLKPFFSSPAPETKLQIFCCHDNHAPNRGDDPGKPRMRDCQAKNYYFSQS